MRSIHIIALALLCAPASNALAHGDLHLRIAKLTAQIAEDSLNGELYLKRGHLYLQHTDWVEAELDYRTALRHDADLFSAHLGLARVFAQLKQPDSGLVHIRIFLNDHPHHPRALRTRAELFQQKELHVEAVQDLQTLVENASPLRPIYIIELAQALHYLDPNSTVKATDAIDSGIAKLGFVITLYETAIDLCLAADDYTSALRYTDKVIQHLHRKEYWLAKQGDIHLAAGNDTDATKSYEQALEAIAMLPAHLNRTEQISSLRIETEASLSHLQ